MNTSAASPSVLALSGGIGGAKLALGLTQAMPPESLLIVGNTGDDFEHLGLHVSPDLDTLMYTLSGKADPEKGWGLASESWAFMQALEALGGETWFQLGDGDLATHVERTQRLRAGEHLTEIISDFCRRLGIASRIVPVSDDPVRTIVETPDGDLAFQHYFVRERCQSTVSGFRFQGADAAQPSPFFLEALKAPSLQAVVICPSNPFLSIDPILAVRGVREALQTCRAPVIAVSPLVGGDAVKGPTAKNLRELGHPVSATAVANYYRDFLKGFVVDTRDKATVPEIEKLGLTVEVADTLMTDLESKAALARIVLNFSQRCER
ncbi:MAG: 2-phospho-L-lactate transferase [Deltaproteobacteria bacterium]|jgi:LPPG:FO 2-phospho-L-lactate transferase|nr:2-phospho-L-lactate transferase [Deltaproteobacteria bacterium]MDP7158566.1 2-phospho-L-lactate transferase [SAR324 cluster bacterium]MDP7462912.1 2-phospho-L-lactate transferase [SAR324 cluster bacterium]MDP7630339.1 2-phospho-L-lactate transferase [SAR324 cluster bacterium]